MRMWHDPKAMNALSLTLTIMALAALLWTASHWLVRQPSFTFRQVVVRDIQRADAAHVAAVIRRELKGTFFTMDLDGAQRALRQVPWVRNASLQREWPDRLEVSIEEFEPFAYWNDARLVTRDGVVFAAPYDGELPELTGNDDEAIAVIGRFEEWSARLLPLGLRIYAVRHSPRGSWRVEAFESKNAASEDEGNGGAGRIKIIELGRDLADARLERFVAVYRKTVGALSSAGARADYIDLRYQNGLAVRAADLLAAEGKPGGKAAVRDKGRT